MSEADIVLVNVSIAAAAQPTKPNLNTPCVVAYHTHSASRLLTFATASALSAMVAAGFSVNEPAYKAVSRIASVPNAPALVTIGRRANKPLQTILLTCTDGTVLDAYSFTLVGSDGVSHALTYTNVTNPGPALTGASALSGTATVTQGSTAVTFSTAQTLTAGTLVTFSTQTSVSYAIAASTTASTSAVLTSIYTGASSSTATTTPGATTAVTLNSTAVTFSVAQTLSKGTLLTFASQPGVAYILSANVTSSTSGTLTAAYTGTTAAAAQTEFLAPLSGTFNVVNGSSTVATSTSQVGVVYPGDSLTFAQQPGFYYTVVAVTASAVTLTQNYTGTSNTTTTACDVCTAATAATVLAAQIAPLTNLGTTTVVNAVSPAPNAGQAATLQLSRTDGSLTDVQSWMSNGFQNIQLTDTTADPGIAADLAAINAAGGASFYGIVLDSNSAAEIEAAAAWVEATGRGGKVLFSNNSDYQNLLSSVTTDLFSVLKSDTYARTFCVQSNMELLSYAGASICGNALGRNPGSYTLAFQSLPGVPADSAVTLNETEQLALNSMSTSNPGPGAKNGNWYATTGGINVVFPGCAPSGLFFDVTIFCDWLVVNIQQACYAVITNAAGSPGKVPYTDPGMALLGNAVQGVLRLGSTKAYGGIVPDGQDPTRPIVVNVTPVSQISTVDRGNRNVPAGAITYSAGLTGAVETLTVQGTVF